jgi:hypothetical protein
MKFPERANRRTGNGSNPGAGSLRLSVVKVALEKVAGEVSKTMFVICVCVCVCVLCLCLCFVLEESNSTNTGK